jgi:hypothetical protein
MMDGARQEIGGGMKSASKTATNSPVAVSALPAARRL